MLKKTTKNIVVFASGSGSNAIKIYEYFQKDKRVNIKALCCNKKSAPVIQKFQYWNQNNCFRKKQAARRRCFKNSFKPKPKPNNFGRISIKNARRNNQ